MTARRFAVPDPAWATPSLFPDLVPLALPAGARRSLSADRRRTARQHLDIARGRHPLTRGPLTAKLRATCGNCTHRVLVDGGRHRAYPKCEVSVMTRGAATDVRAWWPGCTRHEDPPDVLLLSDRGRA